MYYCVLCFVWTYIKFLPSYFNVHHSLCCLLEVKLMLIFSMVVVSSLHLLWNHLGLRVNTVSTNWHQDLCQLLNILNELMAQKQLITIIENKFWFFFIFWEEKNEYVGTTDIIYGKVKMMNRKTWWEDPWQPFMVPFKNIS